MATLVKKVYEIRKKGIGMSKRFVREAKEHMKKHSSKPAVECIEREI